MPIDIQVTLRGSQGAPLKWAQQDANIVALKSGAEAAFLQGDAALAMFDRLLSTDPGDGAELIMIKSSAPGSQEVLLAQWIEGLPLNAVTNFRADNTGATNTTSQLLAFYEACIITGRRGVIPAGIYKVTFGLLVFSCAFTETSWPIIETDGVFSTFFVADPATSLDAPGLYINNGTASSVVGEYWVGGYHGGLTFVDTSGATAPNRHGLKLRGMDGTVFGPMRFVGMRGDGIHIEQALYSGTNPDPYAVSGAIFDYVTADAIKGTPFKNNNYLGLTGSRINFMRATNCEGGVFYGAGAENEIGFISAGSCKGWAFDDGAHSDITGGRPEGFKLGGAEIDDIENGFRICGLQIFDIRARLIHRRNGSAFNTSGNYWPRTGVELASGFEPAVATGNLHIVHRVDAGGVGALKSQVGKFLDCSSNAGIANLTIDMSVRDNAGFGFTDADLLTGIDNNAQLRVNRDGKPILDYLPRLAFLASSTTSVTVPNSGWFSAANKIAFPTVRYNGMGIYDVDNNWAVIPYKATLPFSARIMLTLPVGTAVRFGVAIDRGGSIALVGNSTRYSANASIPQDYAVSGSYDFQAGDKVFVVCEQNTGAAVNLAAPGSAASDLQFSVGTF